MKKNDRRAPFYIIGLLISVLAPLFAVLSYFPIWKNEGIYAQLSGLSLCLILICAVPFFRALKKHLLSPGAPLLWFFMFILFFSLSKIADEVTVVSFVGFISNLIGTIFFRLGRRRGQGTNENEA